MREGAVLGERSSVGRGGGIGREARVGSGVIMQNVVWITDLTVVEDDVFFGPNVVTMNDDTMKRHEPGFGPNPPTIRRAARVGGGALITPGVNVGEESFVAAGAVVAHDVAPRAKVMGIPARVFGEVADSELIAHWR